MEKISKHLPEQTGSVDIKALHRQLTEQGRQQTEKHLREVSRQSSTSAGNTSTTTRLAERHLDLLWQRLSEIYGHKLVSAYGNDLPTMWRESLAAMSVMEIKSGIQALLNSGEEWPPTLPVFIKLCKGGSWQNNTAAYRIVDKSRLIEQQATPEVVSGAMDKIREAMSGGTQPKCDEVHTVNAAEGITNTHECKL